MANLDWKTLQEQVDEGFCSGFSSSNHAMRAIALLIGNDVLRDAVDYYVSGEPGNELARSVLWHIHPWASMQRCYEIFKSGEDIHERRAAIELLRVAADRRVLPWMNEFLADPDVGVQTWAAGILDQLSFSKLVELEEIDNLLQLCEKNPNPKVRESASQARAYFMEQ